MSYKQRHLGMLGIDLSDYDLCYNAYQNQLHLTERVAAAFVSLILPCKAQLKWPYLHSLDF